MFSVNTKRRHKPTGARFGRPITSATFAICKVDGNEGITSFLNGPFEIEAIAVDQIGKDESVIVRLNANNTLNVLWTWDSETQEWVEA
jgi:hypothetical protein